MAHIIDQPDETTLPDNISEISEEEARWIADFNIMLTLGDAMYISLLERIEIGGNRIWVAEVAYPDGKVAGELHIDAGTGQNVTWHPCG